MPGKPRTLPPIVCHTKCFSEDSSFSLSVILIRCKTGVVMVDGMAFAPPTTKTA